MMEGGIYREMINWRGYLKGKKSGRGSHKNSGLGREKYMETEGLEEESERFGLKR